MSQIIKVLVADDLKVVGEGLRLMFASVSDIELVAFAQNGKQAIQLIEKEQPDIVLIDVVMPVMGGIEATKQIVVKFPHVDVIVFSAFENDPAALEAITAGAKSYILKNLSTEELIAAIRTVKNGGTTLAPGVITNLTKCLNSKSNIHKNLAKSQKVKKENLEKSLFKYGDWLAIALGIILCSQTKGAGHYLAHIGLLLLMLALIARPIKAFWDFPLKHRRAIGILAFATSLAHVLYATNYILDTNLVAILFASSQHRWGMVSGITGFMAMTPPAVTSFQFLQKKLGKKWRQIHLLSVPALGLAVLHTLLIGPEYFGQFEIETIDHLRSYILGFSALMVFAIRKKVIKKLK